MARGGIEVHNGLVQLTPGGINYIPSSDPLYYGSMKTVKVGSATYVITKGSKNPTFIWQSDEDMNDSDYMQFDTEDGLRSVIRGKGTQWTGFCNLIASGNGKGLFVITGANLGVLASGIPANLAQAGDGSGVVVVASDNINKAVVMYYVAATKKLTFRNSDNEVNELVLA